LELTGLKTIAILSKKELDVMAKAAFDLSQQYTFDSLEKNIKKVLESTF